MTPNEIEILIHCHTSPSAHPRMDAPAVEEAHICLAANGLIEQRNQNNYHTTDRGKAHIEVLCRTPWPIRKYVNQLDEVIEFD